MSRNYKFHNPEGLDFLSFISSTGLSGLMYEHCYGFRVFWIVILPPFI